MDTPKPISPGLIVREQQPENLEFRFETLESFLTPNMARAHDSRGRMQPLERDPGRLNAVITHVLGVEVVVRT